jgi:hypothetical protein
LHQRLSLIGNVVNIMSHFHGGGYLVVPEIVSNVGRHTNCLVEV